MINEPDREDTIDFLEKEIGKAEQRNRELEEVNAEHEKQIHKLIQECERLREKLDAELFGFPCKPLEQPR